MYEGSWPSDPIAFAEPELVDAVSARMREVVGDTLHRRGVVVGLSGDIDSSVYAALATLALGPHRVYGLLMMPEPEASPDSLQFAHQIAAELGIETRTENIGAVLKAMGCRLWRDDAIRCVFPDYGDGWRHRIVVAGSRGVGHFNLVVESPESETFQKPLPRHEYLQIVAATHHEQRVRKTIEYFHAERLHYVVAGTPNRLQYDDWFFAQTGDSAADRIPIARLCETQAYALARHLRLPPPGSDFRPIMEAPPPDQGTAEDRHARPSTPSCSR
jgi:NAD+ synthase